MSKCILLVVAMAAVIVAAQQPHPEAARKPDVATARFRGRRRPRPRNSNFPGYPGARPSPSTPGLPGTPGTPGVPSAPGSPHLCNRTVFPLMSSSPGLSVPGGSNGSCVPAPAPRAPPRFHQPCHCPKAPPHPGFPGLPMPGNDRGTDCVTALAGLVACGTFLTGSESQTPTLQSECCSGLAGFMNRTSSASDGDRALRCLCPVILGDVNKMLPKPMDPVRMMYLPIACGVVLPPQLLFVCFTGQATPPLVSRIPEAWENPSRASSP